MVETKGLGGWGEDEAARLLKKKGYTILERNFRGRFGEIDIVAREGDTLVFVEVKARTNLNFGSAKEAIGLRKRRHIIRASLEYLNRNPGGGDEAIRYDVVTVEKRGEGFETELIRNAFEAED